jgi:hypothetical protein
LWISLPDGEGDATWIVFEGPRPVAAYRTAGVILNRVLLGFGERLFVAPGRFNLTRETIIPLSDRVFDSGLVAACTALGSTVTLTLKSPVMWTEEHKVVAWTSDGCREIGPPGDTRPATEWQLTFTEGTDGIALFHDGAWLGTAVLVPNPKAAAVAFFGGAPSWPDALLFAIDARFPILADDVRRAIVGRMRYDGGRAAVSLCRGPFDARHKYVVGRLLEAWDPPANIAQRR